MKEIEFDLFNLNEKKQENWCKFIENKYQEYFCNKYSRVLCKVCVSSLSTGENYKSFSINGTILDKDVLENTLENIAPENYRMKKLEDY